MAERRIINGYIVERGDDGQLRTIGPANGPAPQMPADPTFQYEGPQASATLTKTQLDNKVTEATLPYALRKAAADAAAAEAAAAKAGQAGPESETQLKAGATAGDLRTMMQTINELQTLYNQNLAGQGPLQSIGEYFPSNANDRINTLSAGLGQLGMSAFRVPGSGEQSDRELANFIDANQPSTWNRDSGFIGKLDNLRRRAENRLQELGQPAPEWVLPTDQIQEQPQANNDMAVAGNPQGPDRSNRADVLFGQPPSDNQNGGFVPYGAETRLERNPQWKGVNEAVKGMIVAGRSPEEIKGFLNSKGIAGDAARGVDEAINYFRKTGKDNFGVDVEKIQVPMSGTEQFFNNAPQTRVGTAAATALNAGGFGIPQMLAGGQGLDYLRQQNPGSAFAGDVAGVIGGTAALGRAGGALAGKVAPSLLGGGAKSAAGRQLATDATYGGIYGSTTEGDPLTGAATAALGSGLGMGIGKGIQKGLTGVTDPAVQYLTQRGIPLTIGQTLGNRGVIGKTMNKLESLPVLGDMMGARRLDGLQAFEREALKDVVAPVGGSVTTGGAEGLAQAQGAVSQAYRDALSGVNVSPDQQFIQEAGQAMQAGAAVPKFGEDFTYAMNQEVGPLFGQGGNLSGPQLQSALQSIGKIRSGFGKNPDAMASYAADAAGQMEDALSNLVGRQAPDVMPAYNDAKGAFSRLAPFEKARIGAINQEAITPAQLSRAVTSNTNKFGGRAAAARGDNLTDLMRYGQEVLPSTVPNSGTADRGLAALFLPAALGGGAAYSGLQENPGTAGLLATLAAMSTKTGQKALQKALTSRPGSVRKAGGLFGSRKAQRAIGGAITAPLLIE